MGPLGFFAGEPDLVALVTGAGSGIGVATAQRLVGEGVRRLVLTDRDSASLTATAATLGLDERDVMTAAFNVADETAWNANAKVIRERFGRLDLAVANAGVTSGGTIAEASFAEWRRVMSSNLDGVFLTLKTCMKLIAEGGQGGSIVVVASVTGLKAQPGTAAYGASKAGVRQLAKVAALEGAPNGILVNSILPGGVETPIWRDVPFFRDQLAKTGSEQAAFNAMAALTQPSRRYSKPEEIAGQIAFLLSETAANITGTELIADGGYAI
ncbi:MAG TPA: SDR family NAD(P)-dependent oxidoreductase [Alphaproteobacteria bacterium]|jgi:NAD(P)-dependent dehydrogenase (short-subunit alcohol dehydrogenase family)|nr:SDR family NAD(P)-dependent oxidoreductase [Alphaproteobacteria bacterium]